MSRRWCSLPGIVLAALTLASCPRPMPQDAHTGIDGESDGAERMFPDGSFDDVRTTGRVSYPEGDRVDWKVVYLPPNLRGELNFLLRIRRSTGVSFLAYDEEGTLLGEGELLGTRNRGDSARVLNISNARRKVYVLIYAIGRADAAEYEFAASFFPTGLDSVDPAGREIPSPPTLAAVPPVCDPDHIDRDNPECDGVYPPCDFANPSRSNPRCCAQRSCDQGKGRYCRVEIVSVDTSAGPARITIGVGTNDKVARGTRTFLIGPKGIERGSSGYVETIEAASAVVRLDDPPSKVPGLATATHVELQPFGCDGIPVSDRLP